MSISGASPALLQSPSKVTDLAASSGVGKDGKNGLDKIASPSAPTPPRPLRPEKQPKDFDLHKGSDFKRAETKLREKHSAEKGWKQDVSNPL
ncbi:hypothetical protein [Desulfitobacterium hafniense]|uniref:Uncharacterized protein n=1 Tax=Desulfitobacterium hafniense (strain Y51) TaxID=138119 RepID=Q24XW1_DESHY|nr:hypothetical protein [Desulfitobacterium hafniense]BAE83131.1 hypothetical protein DSY1342 [Desulfitobacterium hafniense Y51]